MDEGHSPIQHTVVLRRVEPEQNVARFYALTIERDLFERIVLVRHWGRVGTQGRKRSDDCASEEKAAEALEKLAALKRRRGYRALCPVPWADGAGLCRRAAIMDTGVRTHQQHPSLLRRCG